jgi:hypothetical protein
VRGQDGRESCSEVLHTNHVVITEEKSFSGEYWSPGDRISDLAYSAVKRNSKNSDSNVMWKYS